MGWTHDSRNAGGPGVDPRDNAVRSRRASAARSTPQGVVVVGHPGRIADLQLGIPRILRRRARWVSARLRHPRG
ncbi:hypothetical protein ACFYYR_24440 [Streptomyces sp. NPDC001922]|uniref:hypothetical protein n=1 Tax=unclassified Streptomyces TaxID=2593676 RepID=UPI00331F37A6